MLRRVTAKQYREHHQGREAYIDTMYGRQRINYVNPNYWAHCPEANAGLGRSAMLHAASPVWLAVESECDCVLPSHSCRDCRAAAREVYGPDIPL